MRALVTGAGGFAGRYLSPALAEAGYEVFEAGGPHDGAGYRCVDFRDAQAVSRLIAWAQPDLVFHLAAQTFVPDAIESPLATYDVNVLGTGRLLEAVRSERRSGHGARVVLASSADVYGLQEPQAFPLRETQLPRPGNPYAASKLAAEAVALAAHRAYGLDVVVTRAFNHIGPSQNARFAVAAFAAQLARIAAGGERLLLVGNLTAQRDILDVRDVVAAYLALARHGVAGEIYNVCSGVPRVMRDLLRELILIAHVPVEVREDAARMRPSDQPVSFGSNDKLRTATGWEPRIALMRSLREIYEEALERARVSPG